MIYLEVINKEWRPGIRSLELTSEERASFEWYVAEAYSELVKRAVYDQRYSNKWTPLSVHYKQYKIDNNLDERMWIATGELISQVTVKYGARVGFDNRRVHKGSGLKYLHLARILEYGSPNGIPARPLFRSVYSYMSKNISRYYDQWMRSVS